MLVLIARLLPLVATRPAILVLGWSLITAALVLYAGSACVLLRPIRRRAGQPSGRWTATPHGERLLLAVSAAVPALLLLGASLLALGGRPVSSG